MPPELLVPCDLEPARYLPFVYDGGRYQVKAGMHPIATDFGNGARDRLVFQRDACAAAYLDEKQRAARLAAEAAPLRSIIDEGCRAEVLRYVDEYVRRQLVGEGHFTTAELAHWRLDALVMQLQEDLAIVESVGAGATRLAYLHVSLPSGWSPWTKRGKGFADVHRPVPGADRIDGDALMLRIIERGQTLVRFAWGMQFDARLDQHPKRGRCARFDPDAGLWVRVERQVAVGLPAVHAMLFVIHPFVVPVADVLADGEAGRALLAAVAGMSDAELRYKGLRRDRGAIVDFLRSGLDAS